MTLRRWLALALTAVGLVALPGPVAARAPGAIAPGTTMVFTQRYVGEDGEYHYQLWTRDGDGSTHAIVTDPWFKPFSADLSPDGRQVAITVGPFANVTTNGIYVVNIDGSGRHNLIAGNSSLSDARDPNWSPDGRRLVFVGVDRALTKDLWTVASDGTGLRRLTHCDCAGFNTPLWSPDGTKILWSPQLYDVAVLDAGSGESTTIYDNTLPGHVDVSSATWGPDGRTVVMSAPETWAQVDLALWSIPVDGGNRTLIAREPGASFTKPHFSPDGTEIGFTLTRSGDASYDSRVAWISAEGPYTGYSFSAGALVDELTAWGIDCDCTPGGRFSSLSVHTNTTSGGIEVGGGLLPGLAGEQISLVIQKKPRRVWKPLQRLTVTTSAEALYFAVMKRSAGRLCRVRAVWAGDATHDAARARSRPFGC